MTDKTLPASALKRSSQSDMSFTTYFEVVRGDVEFHDIFYPQFWQHHKTIRPHSMIRIRSEIDTFDFTVVVRAVVPGGLVVEFNHGRVPAGIEAEDAAGAALADATRLKMAPIAGDGRPLIRTQFLPKTKWRLIGLNSEEVKRDMANQIEAEKELALYLATMFMRQPTDEELLAHAKAKQQGKLAADAKETQLTS